MSLFVLDTDHVTLLRKGHPAVVSKISVTPHERVSMTIITFEEFVSGWYAQLRQARDAERLSRAYAGLEQTLDFSRRIPVLPFLRAAVDRYFNLRRAFPRHGKQDLKIASIVLEHFRTLITRNRQDFETIPGLIVEDWSV